MKNAAKLILLMILAALGSQALSACGASKPEPTPTLAIGAIQTSAVSTFAAGLTQTAIAQPTITPSNTPTNTPTATPTRSTPLAPRSGAVPTVSCYRLILVSDVTIPDNTPMVPGQTFTKTWRVKNNGSCPWESGFKFAFTTGDAMGGTTQVLDKVVSPGAEMDLSIAMTVPNKTGLLQGNWQMSTTTGTFFNDVVWVIIKLSGATTTVVSTATATATMGVPTATTTATATVATEEPTAVLTP